MTSENHPAEDGARSLESLSARLDSRAFAAELAACEDPLPLLREAIGEINSALRAAFYQGESVAVLVHRHAEVIDRLLTHAWRRFVPGDAAGAALIAVGGYGRGELHPYSDIDVLILLRDGQGDAFKDPIEKLVVFLWDMGLQIGHSVRSMAECRELAAVDITVATTLMESRLLAGPRGPVLGNAAPGRAPTRCGRAASSSRPSGASRSRATTSITTRPTTWNPTSKRAPAGLRDIQMIGWVAKRHFGAETLHDLVTHGFLTDDGIRAPSSRDSTFCGASVTPCT